MNIEHQSLNTTMQADVNELSVRRVLLIETLAGRPESSLRSKLCAQGVLLVDVMNCAGNVLEKVTEHTPEALVLSVDFLDRVTLEQLLILNSERPLPIIVFAQQHAPKLANTVVEAGISSYVVDDVQAHRIPVIIELAVARFEKMQTLNAELQQTKNRLSERKLIEKAKGLIMQQNHLSEDEAYSQMRKSAMDQGRSMAELSKRIIEVFDMLG